MVALLNGGAKALFGEILGGTYPAARVFSGDLTYATDGTLQVGDNPRDCKAKVDSATERMRTEPGFSLTDRAIYILAATLDGDVQTGQTVEILEGEYAGAVYGVASADRPGGCSYWLCRGAKKSG